MGARILLGVSAAVWLPYGLLCLALPDTLQTAAGVAFFSPTGRTEIRAMYGGLQIAIGVLCCIGLVRASWQQTALRTLLVLASGLIGARLLGGFIDASFSAYTVFAALFEAITVGFSAWLLREP